jgi:hypothetical protein
MRKLIAGMALGLLLWSAREPDGAIWPVAGAAAQAGQRPMTAILLPPQKSESVPEVTDALRGVSFDLNGDGYNEQTGWPAQNSGLRFLALDRNGNGRIDNGKDLFGMDLIRFGGHLPKGGYDVPNGRNEKPTAPSAVHG